MARPSPSLLRKDGSYPRPKWERLCNWMDELHESSKHGRTPFILPYKRAQSNLAANDGFRLDCQGYFQVPGHTHCGWYNLQVQENRPRNGPDDLTTVMTTYVHQQGYDRDADPRIFCSMIAKVMESQAKHAIPEMSIFVWERDDGGREVKSVQRSPHGLLQFANPPWNIAAL